MVEGVHDVIQHGFNPRQGSNAGRREANEIYRIHEGTRMTLWGAKPASDGIRDNTKINQMKS